MADPTFDGINKTIDLASGVTSVDVERDLYSAWKRWVKNGDGSKYDVVFDNSFGGNDVGNNQFVAPYFIFRNDLGWRIHPFHEDNEITFVGNLYASAPATQMFGQDSTNEITIILERSVNALQLGDQTPTAADIAVAVWAEIIRTGDTSADLLLRIERLLRNKLITDPVTGVQTLYDDDNTTPLLSGNLYEGVTTSQSYRGQGAERRERLT